MNFTSGCWAAASSGANRTKRTMNRLGSFMVEFSLAKDRNEQTDFAQKRINHKGHEGTQRTQRMSSKNLQTLQLQHRFSSWQNKKQSRNHSFVILRVLCG